MPDAQHRTDRMTLPYPDRSQPADIAAYIRQLAEAVDAGAATRTQVEQLIVNETFRPRGAWDSGTGYGPLDVVRHAGASWVAVDDAPAGTEPGADDAWILFAESADDAAANVETLHWMGA